jgi:PAS domain S-box-containing protein
MKLSTRLILAMVALVLLSGAIIGVFTYRNVEALVLPRALARIDSDARLLALELEASVRGARADVLGFRASDGIARIVQASLAPAGSADRAALPDLRARFASRLTGELAAKPNYAQFRIIGIANGGREIVRVDRSGPGGAIHVVPEAELQAKGDSGYVQRASALPPGEVDISPVELNQEQGAIEMPHMPVIRAAAVIHAPDGQPFGIVAIDVDLRLAFARIRAAAPSDAIVYLVNERGDYLVHPDPSREFGFEFGKPQRLQNDFPSLAGILTGIAQAPRMVRGPSGEEFGIAAAPVRLAQGPLVTLVEAAPYSRVMAAVIAVRNSSLLAGLLAILVAIALAIMLARSLTRPLERMTEAVEAFGRGEPMTVPANATGELGTLSRAFARIASQMQEKSEELTKEVAERRQLFETSLDLILVVDPTGLLVRVNPSAFAILGYRTEDMIGRNAVEFIYPDDLERTRNEMRTARRGRLMRNFDCRYVHKNGHPVTLHWSGVWSEAAQRHFFIGRDMTESRTAEEALRESERVARGIVDTALDALVQMDEAGIIVEWNPQAEKTFGWSRDDVIGQSLAATIIPPAYRARHAAGLARFLRTGEGAVLGKRIEIDALARDGREFKVEIAITALRRRGGYVFNGFIRDLTDKIAAEAQLRQAQRMDAIGQLTGGVAHDFNNILTVITGTIEILGEGVADRPDLAAIAKMIDEAATRGASLTQQLLAFARRQPLEPRKIDPNSMIMETARLLRPTLGEHIEIEAMLEDDGWLAIADPAQLGAALLNLAVNARDAMPNGGKLTLETGNVMLDEAYAQMNPDVHPGPYVMVAVSDTGIGIPAALLEKVFEPFFTTKEVGKGTGLGLSMVYGFVKQSGGHIKVYSEEGHGTSIKIYLPRAEEAVESLADAAPVSPVPFGHETILVVEDDKLVRDYVVTQLGSLGYLTLAAENAAVALAYLASETAFDLLFTDIIMPGGMNGRELADAITRQRPNVKVLYTSGYTENAIVHHGRLDPGVALLNKPYRKKDLAEKLRQVLDRAAASADATAG